MAPLQHLRQECGARTQGVLVIFGKTQLAHAAQQDLGALGVACARGQGDRHLVRQRVEQPLRLFRRQLRFVLGGDPQGRLEQGGRVLGKTGKAGLTRVHGVLRLTLRL